MRDLLALTARPGVISLAGGLPADDNLPLTQLQTCLEAVLTRDGARALQYGPPFAPLKEQIALLMQARGVECTPDEIFITNGNQQGLELAARLLLNDGDSAALEQFTFTGIQQAVSGRGAEVLAVPTDLQTGIEVDALEATLEQHHPKLAVIIPDFHNPLGVSVSAEKRAQIAALSARHQLPIIEDDPYSALRFDGEATAPLKAFDEAGRMIYLGSFSKMLAPALRLGWMVAPRELLPRLTVLRESLDLESSQLTQRTVAEFLARGLLTPHLAQLNAANRNKRNQMLAALERELGGLAHWTAPEGGLFIWLTLPEGVDTAELFNAALVQDVAFVPGSAFAADGTSGANCARLNFSKPTLEQIDTGITRLANVIKEQITVNA
jgi:2-aminoadipate transaminase